MTRHELARLAVSLVAAAVFGAAAAATWIFDKDPDGHPFDQHLDRAD